MTLYFYDSSHRYIGNRTLATGENLPDCATTVSVSLKDGEQAHWDGTKWTKSAMPTIETEPVEQTKTMEQRIEEMAEQLVPAQEALDFLIMGGM